VRENSRRDEALTRIAGDLFPTLTGATGPFEGLQYPRLQSVGSALLPKLLGLYESELHAALGVACASLGISALIVADCEGYEKESFDDEMGQFLAKHSLIIETHDFIDI
jgi:hypothetical protein